jgi:predicted nucleic acid-binding protein
MILVDTSIWVNHFRQSNLQLVNLLTNDQVLCHPLVILEIACGSPPAPRLKTLEYLEKLQTAKIATVREIMTMIENHKLHDSGCGATDMSLLASTLLTENAKIWTQDKSLEMLSKKLGVSFTPEFH